MDEKRVFERLTLARIRLLREIGEGYPAPKIAERLGMTVNGVRSRIGADEIGRWWRKEGGPKYMLFLSEEAGVDLRLIAV